MLILLLLHPARAASLDLIQVGGMWGTPGATNATAVWWNPAGLAAASGTQFVVEGAPTFAQVDYDRTEPRYDTILGGGPNPTGRFGGEDTIRFNGVVPFLGVSSDFGVDALGLGVGVGVPFARGGGEVDEPGPGRFHLRDGNVQAIYLMAGGGWTFGEVFSIGIQGAVVDSQWDAVTDVETLSVVRQTLADEGLVNIYCSDGDPDTENDDATGPCDDALMESDDYDATLTLDKLRDRRLTFGTGIYIQPSEQVGISVAYHHGVRLDNEGDLGLLASCAPLADALGTEAGNLSGLCSVDGEPANVRGTARVGYKLPSRVHAGVVLRPVEKLRLEAMGGFVMWSQFSAYEIRTSVKAEEFEDTACRDNDGQSRPCDAVEKSATEQTAALTSQNRRWARDNRDTFWLGIDSKVRVHRLFTAGGRVLFDRAAVPVEVLTTNNFDTDSLGIGLQGALHAGPTVRIGLSAEQQILFGRTNTDSAFGLTLAEDHRKPDAYYYPEANGTYGGRITRLGLSVTGQFGGS